jgi:hypothetical protein
MPTKSWTGLYHSLAFQVVNENSQTGGVTPNGGRAVVLRGFEPGKEIL